MEIPQEFQKTVSTMYYLWMCEWETSLGDVTDPSVKRPRAHSDLSSRTFGLLFSLCVFLGPFPSVTIQKWILNSCKFVFTEIMSDLWG